MTKPTQNTPAKREPAKTGKGAPRGNYNSLRHGLRGSKLPKGCRHVENSCNDLRRQLEEAVVLLKREVNISDAAAINSAVKWERHGLLSAHWLRKEGATLSPADRLRFSEAVAKASDARDKAIRSLGLDQLENDSTPWVIPARSEPVDGNGDLEDK
jgi:hypothetical protein